MDFSFLLRWKPLLIFHFIVLPCRLLLLWLQIFLSLPCEFYFSLWSAIERSTANENDYNYEETFTEINFVYCLVRLIIFHFTLVQKESNVSSFPLKWWIKITVGWNQQSERRNKVIVCYRRVQHTRHLCESKVSKIFPFAGIYFDFRIAEEWRNFWMYYIKCSGEIYLLHCHQIKAKKQWDTIETPSAYYFLDSFSFKQKKISFFSLSTSSKGAS